MTELFTNSLLLVWFMLWALGGVWLARGAFRLRPGEQVIAGIAVGFLLQLWLVNWLARVIPLPAVSWVSAGVVFILGAALAWKSGRLRFHVNLPQMAVFAVLVGVYFMVCRGLAIFDDFAHLPTVSLMATGDIPPHFSFDPNVLYGYHHFLMLFAAQLVPLADLPPWTALDASRAVSFGLAIMLAALWTQRLTGSRLAGFLAGGFLAFGSGTRWLLLLLPRGFLLNLGESIQMIGSGAASGSNLSEAMSSPWAAEGMGVIPFPFAFVNGIFSPGVINGFSVNGLTSYAVILLLLLTCTRWRGWAGAVISAIVLSTWGLLAEVELVVILAGWGVVGLGYAIQHKTLRLPASLWRWAGVVLAGALIGFLSGGALTDLIFRAFQRITLGSAPPSYQTVGFTLAPPALVSSHLGVLSVLNPAQLLVGLVEVGPLLLVLPLLAVFGLKAFRLGRWYEAAAAATAFVSLALIFVQFTGSTGVRNTSRLYVFIPLCAVFAVPLVWWWVGKRSETVKLVVSAVGMTAVVGGLALGGISLVSAQKPVYSYFLTAIDERMYESYWNRLEPAALVFDPTPSRATTVFGRFTNAAYTWYAIKPEWTALRDSPEPYALQAAGYRYLYLDRSYWNSLPEPLQHALNDPCVQRVEEGTDAWGDFRQLLDIGACR